MTLINLLYIVVHKNETVKAADFTFRLKMSIHPYKYKTVNDKLTSNKLKMIIDGD